MREGEEMIISMAPLKWLSWVGLVRFYLVVVACALAFMALKREL
jgi:hypothetical protein